MGRCDSIARRVMLGHIFDKLLGIISNKLRELLELVRRARPWPWDIWPPWQKCLVGLLVAVFALMLVYSARQIWDSRQSGTMLTAWDWAVFWLMFPALLSIGFLSWHFSVVARPRTAIEILRREMEVFEETACRELKLPKDHVYLRALVRGRRAVQEVAEFIATKWDRGRHTLSGTAAGAYTLPQNGRINLHLGMDILEMVASHLNAERPRYAIESDEPVSYPEPDDWAYKWIVDPIDGSRHVLRQLPVFTTAIALVDAQYRPYVSLVYAPTTGELFFAVRGHGAYMNDWQLLRAFREQCEKAVAKAKESWKVHVEFPNCDGHQHRGSEFDRQCRSLQNILQRIGRIRGFGVGSLGLAYAAKGAFEAYVTLPGTTRRVDVLAGALLVMESYGTAGSARMVRANGATDRAPPMDGVYVVGGKKEVVSCLMTDCEVESLFQGKEDLL